MFTPVGFNFSINRSEPGDVYTHGFRFIVLTDAQKANPKWPKYAVTLPEDYQGWPKENEYLYVLPDIFWGLYGTESPSGSLTHG